MEGRVGWQAEWGAMAGGCDGGRRAMAGRMVRGIFRVKDVLE